jgi:tight adherence protein B
MSRSRRPAVEEVADVAQRMAVLLAAGVPPAAAWGYLAQPEELQANESHVPDHPSEADTAGGSNETDAAGEQARTCPHRRRAVADVTDAVITAAAQAASRGSDVPRAIAQSADAAVRSGRHGLRRPRDGTDVREAWRGLAVAVDVATGSGAPLAGALRDLASALRDLGQTQRDRETALAGPRATARTVLALPAVGILFGVLLGFDTLHVLFATPAGLACLGIGGALLLAARAWNRALLRRATPRDRMPGLSIELVAVAMAGGGSAPGALRRVTDACARFGLAPPDPTATESVLSLAQRAGVGTAELLRAEAEQSRRDARSTAQTASASLGVRLMVPLAVCVLPAFMLLSVAPLVMSILSSTLRGI